MSKAGKETRPEYKVYRTRGRRRRLRIYIILGVFAFLIIAVGAVAGGSYWWFSNKVTAANNRTPPEVKEALAEAPSTTLVSVPQSTSAMNMIFLGSDTRSGTVDSSGRSDTIMVVHVDPDKNYASILSVPRDLYVPIPGHGSNKINAAYAYGGPELTIRTVKNLLGLNITEYAEIDFVAFQKIVDSIGGIYVDVDRRYNNQKPRPINLQAGYQLLNGEDALLFARYRFDSNVDFGRMTRQQRVLTAIREQAMGWNLPLKLPGIIDGALSSMATNLGANDIIKLAKWLVQLDSGRMRQIVIKAPTLQVGTMSALKADKATIKKAVTDLLTPPDEESDATTASDSDTSESDTTSEAGSTTTVGEATTTTEAQTEPLAASTSVAAIPNSAMWKTAQKGVPFQLEAPGYVPSDLTYSYRRPAESGVYQIDPGGDSKPAVRMVYRYKKTDLYVGITATTWLDAPIASPGQKVDQNGVTYTVVGPTGKVDHIWWKTGKVLYVISNTLMYDVSKAELLRMAQSMAPVNSGE